MSDNRFGTEIRNNSHDKLAKLVPGPGQYTCGSFIGKDSPSKSIAGKVEDKLAEKESMSKPGPGAYDAKHDLKMK